MAEHEVARVVVHLGLEGELVLQRDGARGGRSRTDLVNQALDVPVLGRALFALDLRARPEGGLRVSIALPLALAGQLARAGVPS